MVQGNTQVCFCNPSLERLRFELDRTTGQLHWSHRCRLPSTLLPHYRTHTHCCLHRGLVLGIPTLARRCSSVHRWPRYKRRILNRRLGRSPPIRTENCSSKPPIQLTRRNTRRMFQSCTRMHNNRNHEHIRCHLPEVGLRTSSLNIADQDRTVHDTYKMYLRLAQHKPGWECRISRIRSRLDPNKVHRGSCWGFLDRGPALPRTLSSCYEGSHNFGFLIRIHQANRCWR
jgi:hypothetical protein